MQKDITTEGDFTFDSYLATLSTKPSRFAVNLEGRAILVFRRTQDWDDLLKIRQRTIEQTKSVIDGNVHPTWKEYVSNDVTLIGKAVNIAARHVGVIQDGQLIEGAWSELDFLKMAKVDPHGFVSLIDALNDEIGVGWSVEDQDYFRKDAATVEGIQDGTLAAHGGPEDLEQAS